MTPQEGARDREFSDTNLTVVPLSEAHLRLRRARVRVPREAVRREGDVRRGLEANQDFEVMVAGPYLYSLPRKRDRNAVLDTSGKGATGTECDADHHLVRGTVTVESAGTPEGIRERTLH